MNTSEDVEEAERFEELSQGILFLVMLIFCGGTFFMTNMSKIPLPYTVVLFLYGIFVGFWAHLFAPEVATALGDIPPELLFYIFLPVLIFEGSYAMNVHALRRVFPQVLLLASVGVIINTGLLSLPVSWFFPEWSWYAALLLGSLLSATDPVAVVSLLKGLGVDSRITAMVDGEAIMNDGTAIIAFKLLLPAARVGYVEDSTWVIILKCIQLAILPVFLGIVFGSLQAFWLRRAGGGLVRACVTVSVTYVSYYVAGNILGTSGVLTLFFTGTFLSSHCPSIFPGREGNLIYDIWEFLVHLGNTVLFSLVGVILVADVIPTLNIMDIIIIICIYISMLLARLLMLEILLPILNLFSYRLSQREVGLLVHSGLRGGVAVTLALAVLQTRIEAGVEILKVTCGVVLLTLFINATTAEKVVALMGHKRKEQHRMVQMEYAVELLGYVCERALETTKNNAFFRSANWAAAENYVKEHLHNPYEDMNTLEEEEDVVVNRLIMRAFKTSMWRQRDNDLISETVVLTLAEVVARAIDNGRLVEVKDLRERENYTEDIISEEEEARLIGEKLLPLWVSVSEYFLGKRYWKWEHVRAQQNAFMILLSFARCLNDVGPIKYQYVKSELQGHRIESWMTSQRAEVHRVIQLFYANYPAATMCVATSRTVLRAVDEIQKELKKLHENHGFGIKPIAVLEEMVHEMHEDIPRSWEAPKRDNELVVAALSKTPLGRGLKLEEINVLSAMGMTKNFNEGDEIKVDDKMFYVVVFGALKPKRGRWTAAHEDVRGFGCIIGLEAFVTPSKLFENQMNLWIVTSTECQVLCIPYRCINPFIWENSFASVQAFWRAVAVETLLPILENLVTLPTNLEESSHVHLTAILMDGKPLIGPTECNEVELSVQFHLCFYLRGSDVTGLFRNGHTAPCYISALFARRLKWEDPQVVLYIVPVNVCDGGYVPWSSGIQRSQSGPLVSQRNTTVDIEITSPLVTESVQMDISSTFAEAEDIFSSILRGYVPGEDGSLPVNDQQSTESAATDEVEDCVLQNPDHFVTNVPYVNQLFMRYATVLESLCIAALRYVRIPTDPLNLRHAQYISELALDFLMSFCNELMLLCAALRRIHHDGSTRSFPTSTIKEEENELEDMKMVCKVVMWNRMAETHRVFHLRAMVLHMKTLANRRFRNLSELLRGLEEEQPNLKETDSVEELQRILLGLDPK
ncbi:Na/H antiporter-like protein [Trypanosoma theileri]|uniref:Na/H antiporter-like protein n=1 Tax=Trypanosoma theileri TaxID=67003 RepID=A0A1X0NWY7_9TRYP|nr:Na/H antiporter-like protein [Trypanosoma theileri]ORC89205.1 Na/H antiporter-like protein [Trypanosoma theileri]